MGQTIEINGSRRIADVLIIDTDRSLSGQDAEAYVRGQAVDTETFPAELAERLFAADADITRVHVISNAISIQRPAGWTDAAASVASDVVTSFFRYY